MKEAVALFACAANNAGNGLGLEMNLRVQRAVEILTKMPEADVLIASTAIGYGPTFTYHHLVRQALMEQGVHGERIKVCGPSASTVSEADTMEEKVKENGYEKVWVATSLYHMPRTQLIWRKRHGRETFPLVLPMPFSGYILGRIILEVPKFALVFAPKRMQDFCGGILRSLRLWS